MHYALRVELGAQWRLLMLARHCGTLTKVASRIPRRNARHELTRGSIHAPRQIGVHGSMYPVRAPHTHHPHLQVRTGGRGKAIFESSMRGAALPCVRRPGGESSRRAEDSSKMRHGLHAALGRKASRDPEDERKMSEGQFRYRIQPRHLHELFNRRVSKRRPEALPAQRGPGLGLEEIPLAPRAALRTNFWQGCKIHRFATNTNKPINTRHEAHSKYHVRF